MALKCENFFSYSASYLGLFIAEQQGQVTHTCGVIMRHCHITAASLPRPCHAIR